jgi:hypothetical protein
MYFYGIAGKKYVLSLKSFQHNLLLSALGFLRGYHKRLLWMCYAQNIQGGPEFPRMFCFYYKYIRSARGANSAISQLGFWWCRKMSISAILSLCHKSTAPHRCNVQKILMDTQEKRVTITSLPVSFVEATGVRIPANFNTKTHDMQGKCGRVMNEEFLEYLTSS